MGSAVPENVDEAIISLGFQISEVVVECENEVKLIDNYHSDFPIELPQVIRGKIGHKNGTADIDRD